jgi:hypothetical protein
MSVHVRQHLAVGHRYRSTNPPSEVIVTFVVVDLTYNQGRVIGPLDDVCIHLQYASQLGRNSSFNTIRMSVVI